MTADQATDDLKNYYRRRAATYEAIYHRADVERLTEQEDLARAIRRHFIDRDVLEIAAGTGWWTVQAAAVARHVTATDFNAETLEIARLKSLPVDRVTFKTADAYDLVALNHKFDGAIACCWLSHVRRSDLVKFLEGLHAVLQPDAAVFFADNVFVANYGGDLISSPNEPDTYKRRSLEDGSSHLVLKNYFSAADLQDLFGPFARDLDIHMGTHFWWLSYRANA